MRKALLALFFSVSLLGPFSVSAATVYQQFGDDSGLSKITTVCGVLPRQLIGSFAISSGVHELNGGFMNYTLHVPSGQPDGTVIVIISTSSDRLAANAIWSLSTIGVASTSDATNTTQLIIGGSGFTTNTNYYVSACSGSGSEVDITSNYYGGLFFGFILDNAGSSLNYQPGIPNLTDFGISTSTQAAYCASSFSSSTGIIDITGAAISAALCNVAVFLLIPSSGSVSQFYAIASSASTKIPFSYMYEVANQMSVLVASSTSNMITVSIDMSGWASSSVVHLPTQWVVLSTSTVSTYLSNDNRIMFKRIMMYVLYLGFAFWVFRRAQHLLHPSHT